MVDNIYSYEQTIINAINSVNRNGYSCVRLTATMINKNNPDADVFLREVLDNAAIVDYEQLPHGGDNGVSTDALFIKNQGTEKVKLKFYRVTNDRGDRRFSIETLKQKSRNGYIREGDLLYFSTYTDSNGDPHVFMINITNNPPTLDKIISLIGKDEISSKFDEILPVIKEILAEGWIESISGQKFPKDIGDTLERRLKIKTNNNPGADIDGLIEVKTKGESNTMDTLFTLRPSFEGTPIAEYEKNDRNRVSAFTRYYGYESDKHPNCNSLYITIGSQKAPQNKEGFFLDVDSEDGLVNLMKENSDSKHATKVAYWTFPELKHQLKLKHPSTLWVHANHEKIDGVWKFNYDKAEFSREPQFMTFIMLIKEGIITYDWRGYTTKDGKYSGKNHGNAWRIKPKFREALFGSTIEIKS